MKPYENLSDMELVVTFKRGEYHAGEEIYRRYFGRVSGFCGEYLHSRQDGEDVAQSVMCKVVIKQKLLSFRQESVLWSWIKRVSINECNAFYRRNRLYRKMDAFNENNAHQDEVWIDPRLNPEAAAIRQENQDLILRLLEQLKWKYRRAVLLTLIKDFSYREAAGKMGVPLAIFGVYRHRGVRALLKLMRQTLQLTVPLASGIERD